ncbi:MAG TPA: hypothetical protein VFS43_21500 [Polyangiaceae bacterium]|nr:hypothetical protein [Polyangiaceae bacterium]
MPPPRPAQGGASPPRPPQPSRPSAPNGRAAASHTSAHPPEARLGVQAEAHTFANVGHSFVTDGHHPLAAALTRPFFRVRYDSETAEEAWRLIFAHFDRHLAAAG